MATETEPLLSKYGWLEKMAFEFSGQGRGIFGLTSNQVKNGKDQMIMSEVLQSIKTWH